MIKFKISIIVIILLLVSNGAIADDSDNKCKKKPPSLRAISKFFAKRGIVYLEGDQASAYMDFLINKIGWDVKKNSNGGFFTEISGDVPNPLPYSIENIRGLMINYEKAGSDIHQGTRLHETLHWLDTKKNGPLSTDVLRNERYVYDNIILNRNWENGFLSDEFKRFQTKYITDLESEYIHQMRLQTDDAYMLDYYTKHPEELEKALERLNGNIEKETKMVFFDPRFTKINKSIAKSRTALRFLSKLKKNPQQFLVWLQGAAPHLAPLIQETNDQLFERIRRKFPRSGRVIDTSLAVGGVGSGIYGGYLYTSAYGGVGNTVALSVGATGTGAGAVAMGGVGAVCLGSVAVAGYGGYRCYAHSPSQGYAPENGYSTSYSDNFHDIYIKDSFLENFGKGPKPYTTLNPYEPVPRGPGRYKQSGRHISIDPIFGERCF